MEQSQEIEWAIMMGFEEITIALYGSVILIKCPSAKASHAIGVEGLTDEECGWNSVREEED
jgi:hypothetical protein